MLQTLLLPSLVLAQLGPPGLLVQQLLLPLALSLPDQSARDVLMRVLVLQVQVPHVLQQLALRLLQVMVCALLGWQFQPHQLQEGMGCALP